MLRTGALRLELPPQGGGGQAPDAITVLLTPTGMHHYAGPPGDGTGAPERTTLHDLRQVLLDHRAAHPDGLCIERTGAGTRYRAVIAVLDELAICGIGRYTVTEELLPWERRQLPGLAAAR